MEFLVKAKNVNDLKIMMIKKGFTQTRLIKEAKLSTNTVMTIFKGKPVGSRSSNKFCAAMGIDENNFDKYFTIEEAHKSTHNTLAKVND